MLPAVFFGDIKTGLDGGYGSFGGKTEEHVVFEKTEEHENRFLEKTEEWVSVGGYGIPAIPTQT